MSTTLLVADDHPLFRTAVIHVLREALPGVAVAEAVARLTHLPRSSSRVLEQWLDSGVRPAPTAFGDTCGQVSRAAGTCRFMAP